MMRCGRAGIRLYRPAYQPVLYNLTVANNKAQAIYFEDAGDFLYRQKGKRLTLAEAQAQAGSAQSTAGPSKADPTIRICPHCGQKVKSEDIYSELICRQCNGSIPGADIVPETKGRYTGGMADRIKTQVSFYTGFGSAFLYPIPGLVWILLGMGIALATIAVPLLAILAFTAGSGLNPIAEKQDLGWVGTFLSVMFAVQGIYFGAVAYYAMIDTIRTTASGGEQPPSLTWNVGNLGVALAGYLALIGFYIGIVAVMVAIKTGHLPTSMEDLNALGTPGPLIILALLTFCVPMNMIGLASSHALDGLNMVRVFRSIGQLIGHYIFLFLIVLIYLGMYVGGTIAVMKWAGPAIMNSAQKGMEAGLLPMLGGPAAWSVLIGLGFYFAYMIGRILGLFCRSFKEGIDFDL